MQVFIARWDGSFKGWPRRQGVLILASLALAGCAGPHPEASSAVDSDRVPLLGRAAITVAPGIHLLGGLSPSAAYAIETSEGLVLVDSGLQSDAHRLKEQMAALGLDWRRLRAIFLTHAHGDHVGGAEHLRAATGAKVYAGQGDAGVLRAGGPREAFFSVFSMPEDTPHPTTVDVELKGGESLAIGDVRIRALSTPGHTPGSHCYLLERGRLRAFFAGDVISMLLGDERLRSRVRKPLGIYSAYLAPRYRGDARTFLSSLRALRAMPVPDLVLPGHPGGDPTPQSPRLSRRRWEALLDEGIGELQALLARHERDGASFLDGEPKRLLPDLYYLGDFRGAAVYGLFASSKFFLVDAPGGPGLAAFVGDRLRRLGREPVAPTAVLLTACGRDETAGLDELVRMNHARVVASPADLPAISKSCPRGTVMVPADKLSDQGWFPVRAIPLEGRGVAPIAYEVSWAGKTVLFSGRIPTRINHETWGPLISGLSRSAEARLAYLGAIDRLGEVNPDLWLPAVPTDGQNANVYDNEWKDILEDNHSLRGPE
jgi:glyoxylase-like metal-dependent hydrolase (beta-lactamase superfamily II)